MIRAMLRAELWATRTLTRRIVATACIALFIGMILDWLGFGYRPGPSDNRWVAATAYG